jgi:aminoglycoside phosphotransferase family enzyme/predicted kinase
VELHRLIRELARPEAFPTPTATVDVKQTHISVVFLIEGFVYKIKKPVSLGFLDFSTLDRREHFCREEVRLNRRLASEVYLDIVPVVERDGLLHFEGASEKGSDPPGGLPPFRTVVEWAVKMRRLPDDATLRHLVDHNAADADVLRQLARQIAAFHAAADSSDAISQLARFDVVAGNARENFEQTSSHVGVSVSRGVFDRLRRLTDIHLETLRPLIEDRARRNVPRDTHGDLRLDHVYALPGRPAGSDLVIIDCIEFNERFRWADPISDVAFLAMDLRFIGRHDLATAFIDEYLRSADDEPGRALVPFYVAYRSIVRAKVAGMVQFEPEIPEPDRRAALERAKGHWLLALGELEDANRRPALVLIGGLPGTGKSTVARLVAERANFRVIRSDVVRKELAGIPTMQRADAATGKDIYTTDWTRRTYAECLDQAERALFAGERIIVDASFADDHHRAEFLQMASRLRVPSLLFLCETPPETARERLRLRRDDASDADWDVYQRAASRFAECGTTAQAALRPLDTAGSPQEVQTRAIAHLAAAGLI